MRRILSICFVLFFSALSLTAQVKSNNVQTIEGKKYYIHKIEKSQSLYAISKMYGVSVDELYTLNPELRNGAKVNQEIKVPYTGSAATVATPSLAPIDTVKYLTHKIAKGETMYSLGKKYNLNEKELLALNPTLSQGLKEGQIIAVGERNRKKMLIPKAPEVKPVAAPKEKSPRSVIDSTTLLAPKFISKPKKDSYHIALMLPFKLEQSLALDLGDMVRTNTNFPQMPALAVDFYLGFKKAVDSLESAGFDVALDLYDVDEKDSAQVANIVARTEFKDLDMIFGPLHANNFKVVSKKAKDFNIPIISPFTSQNKILHNNALISKTNPSQFTLMEGLCDYVIDSLSKNNANVILVTLSNSDKKEIAFVSAFKKYYSERHSKLTGKLKDTVTTARGMAGLKLQYKANVPNVVVCLSANQVGFTDFVTQLSLFADEKDLTLCGWQGISEMENIDQNYLNSMHYTFPNQYNTTNTEPYKELISDYRKIQDTYPNETYFVAFDIGYYYLKNLKEKGPDFVHTLDQYPMETNYMRFKFVRPDKQTGFDNRAMYIFKYQDYQIKCTGWK